MKTQLRWVGSGLAVVCLGTSLVGCSVAYEEAESDASEGEAVGAKEQESYIRAAALWANPTIQVCWTATGFATEKAWVRDAAEGSWPSGSSLEFVGWGTCPSGLSGFSGIAITPGSAMAVSGGLGQQSDGISEMELDFTTGVENNWARCTLNSLNREDCLRATATHEFGHAIGLAHEHNRDDVASECTSAPQGSNGDTTPTDYDPLSIMNYCGAPFRVSLLDALGVEMAYPTNRVLEVSCEAGCFAGGTRKFVRSDGVLVNEWSARGARNWWSSSPAWTANSSSVSGSRTLAASQLPSGLSTVTYSASVAMNGDSVSGSGQVEKDNSLWTAIASIPL